VLNEIRNRGTEDILTVRMDGLSGFPDAGRAVFPQTRIQRCIVHMVRNSTKFVSYKDLKEVCAGLKAIYRAPGAKRRDGRPLRSSGRASGPNTRSFTCHGTRPGRTCAGFSNTLKKSAGRSVRRTR
jgi:transposase-like protein